MNKDCNFFTTEQVAVMADYAPYLKWNHKDIGTLHMFFNPHRVPIGLTDDEVEICITLAEIRDLIIHSRIAQAVENEDYEKAATYTKPLPFPEEFRQIGPMTRERFKEGIHKYLSSMKGL